MSNNQIWDKIVEEGWQGRSDVELLPDLRAMYQWKHPKKTDVNNFISNNLIDVRLQAILKRPSDTGVLQVDWPIPGALDPFGDPITLRKIAQSGLSFVSTNTGETVNPQNPNIQGFIGILENFGEIPGEMVDEFWALFQEPLFQELHVKNGEDYDDEAALALVRGALNHPKVEATQAIIEQAQTLNTELAEAAATRQSGRGSDMATLNLVLKELASGEDRDVPSVPSGENWE